MALCSYILASSICPQSHYGVLVQLTDCRNLTFYDPAQPAGPGPFDKPSSLV
ncbi:hypothetical protein COCNU_14G007450 [Cocos nucifera]|uniref:Uncharacterized protein n=1 Tax=Cocos nucifera TaxID=13894 RepID=A0A8K0NCJ1_COCNU|nr:hypothetical protein COCNU_14G007450 [Cocos nucifera]